MATVGFTPFAAVHPGVFLITACAMLFAATLAKPGTPGSLSGNTVNGPLIIYRRFR